MGKLNDSPNVKKALFAGATSRNSVQFQSGDLHESQLNKSALSFLNADATGGRQSTNRQSQAQGVLELSPSSSSKFATVPSPAIEKIANKITNFKTSLAEEDEGLAVQLAVEKKYHIENTPWTYDRIRQVKFEEVKAIITDNYEKEKATNKSEFNNLGDLNKEKSEIERFDPLTEAE